MSSQHRTSEELDAASEVECLKAACSTAVMERPPAVADDCQSVKECDGDDSASTAASEIDERWADLADSDEGEEQTASGSSGSGPAAIAPPPRPKWADLADDSDEELDTCVAASEAATTASPPAEVAKPQPVAKGRASKAPQQPRWRRCGEEGAAAGGDAAQSAGAREPTSRSSRREAPTSAWDARPARKAAPRAAEEAQWEEADWWWSEQQQWSYTGSWWGTAGEKRWSSKAPQRESWQQQRYDAWSAATAAKLQCQFFIGIEEDNKFKVTRKVLGPHGRHMKSIAEASGAKLRLRGRGSGFLEGPEQQESADELMLCVSTTDQAGYDEATRLVRELLERVYEEYRSFCRKSGRPSPDLGVRLHEGPRPGSR